LRSDIILFDVGKSLDLKRCFKNTLEAISAILRKNQSMIIKIKNLKLKTILGIHSWEEKVDREIVINVEIETDHRKSLESDEISDAIDYDDIVKKIKNLIATTRFKLVEKMAQQMMNMILQDARIKKCKIEIDKVGAVEGLESFSVKIEQSNK